MRIVIGKWSGLALVLAVALAWNAISMAQRDAPPGDDPFAQAGSLTPQQRQEIEAIRAQIGSVVPNDGLLAPAGANTLQGGALFRLKPDDPLGIELRETRERVEQRARQEASQGNWPLGIALHHLAEEMDAVSVSPP
jgi:hypothetical protein